nr:protein MAIN-LIKE 2-like [Aegilops tauschii subsp. strangulata]
MASLINPSYDQLHHGRFLAEEGRVFDQLHLRFGSVHDNMEYDERYTEYIRKTGLLPFISLVSPSMPKMNPCAITSLIDWRRPETPTFHFYAGEMTVTLQDVSLITGLPIKGEPICFSTDSAEWCEIMVGLIGREPGVQGKSTGASYHWIAEHFGECPADVDDEIVHWGTAALAYLYRQLDEACLGRSTPKGYDPWDDYHDPDHMPTWAYKWDKVEGFVGNSKTMYLHYCRELDIMTPEQVSWELYGTEGNIGFDQMANMEYNRLIRDGRRYESAPTIRFVQNELSKHVNDAGEALKYPPGGDSYNKLKAFVEPSQRRGTPGKYARKARKDPVIEAASEEEEEEVPQLQRRRRLVKGKDAGPAKRGKGRK